MAGHSNRLAGVIATATIVATTIAPSAPIGAQVELCDGHPVSAGVTSEFDDDSNVTRITGTAGPDVIVGTEGRDIIHGLSGQDTICGLAANDVIYGGNGADRIFGQNGSDLIFGGNGRDTIFAGRGNDRVRGGAHGDLIRGGAGDDQLIGNAGPDSLRGDRGRDTCSGGNGTDTTIGCELGDVPIDAPTVVSAVSPNSQADESAVPEVLAFSVACTQTDLVNYYQSLVGTESETLADAEQRLFELVNETRSLCNLGVLESIGAAETFAQQHADDMLALRISGTGSYTEAPGFPWFGHSDLWARIAQDDPTDDIVRAGENVAFVSQGLDPVLVHVNLLRSGTHMCNIVNPGYDSMGLGYAYFEPGIDGDGADGQIVAQIYAGDTEVDPTSGQLIVQDQFGSDDTETLDCWN